MNLQQFKDDLSRSVYGLTAEEAWVRRICVSCKKDPGQLSSLDFKEWTISALCPRCFAEACGPEE